MSDERLNRESAKYTQTTDIQAYSDAELDTNGEVVSTSLAALVEAAYENLSPEEKAALDRALERILAKVWNVVTHPSYLVNRYGYLRWRLRLRHALKVRQEFDIARQLLASVRDLGPLTVDQLAASMGMQPRDRAFRRSLGQCIRRGFLAESAIDTGEEKIASYDVAPLPSSGTGVHDSASEGGTVFEDFDRLVRSYVSVHGYIEVRDAFDILNGLVSPVLIRQMLLEAVKAGHLEWLDWQRYGRRDVIQSLLTGDKPGEVTSS